MEKIIAAARALVAQSKVTTALHTEVDTLEEAIIEYDAAPVAAVSSATPATPPAPQAVAGLKVASPTMPPSAPSAANAK